LRQHHHHVIEARIEEHGAGVSRKQWKEHRNEANMIKDAGLAYWEAKGNGREIYCPVCLEYCGSKGDLGIGSHKKLHVTKQCVARHLGTARHKQALQLQGMEMERKARRARVGLSVGKTTLHTLREGCSYLRFEEKLLTLRLSLLDIGSMNHSVKFIEGFVNIMEVVMDGRIRDHIRAIDEVTCRKRLFAFAADRALELHRTGDVVGMLIMTEEGVIKPKLSLSATCWLLNTRVALL